MSLVVGKGRAQIKLDDGLARSIRRVLDQVAPQTIGTLEATADDVIDAAKAGRGNAAWPVKSGRSKRALGRTTRLTRTAVEVVISDPVDYVFYVKFKRKLGGVGGKSVWQTLIAKPAKRRARELAGELAEGLGRLAGRG